MTPSDGVPSFTYAQATYRVRYTQLHSSMISPLLRWHTASHSAVVSPSYCCTPALCLSVNSSSDFMWP